MTLLTFINWLLALDWNAVGIKPTFALDHWFFFCGLTSALVVFCESMVKKLSWGIKYELF